MEANHDGEGASRQHLLVVVVVQAVSCCQGKSVANLRGMDKDIVLKAIFDPIGSNKQEICTYYHRAAIAVDVVVLVVVLVTEQCSNPRVSIDLKKIFN